MTKKKHLEFSKILVILVLAVCIAVIVFACVMMWRTCDLSPLAYIIPTVGTATSTCLGFYFWKAKAENKIKLAKAYGIELTEQTLNYN